MNLFPFIKKILSGSLFCILLITSGWTQPFVKGVLIGQLGNQMFIIAATASLAMDHDAIPVFPDLVSNTSYNIPLNREKIFTGLEVYSPQKSEIKFYYNEPFFHHFTIPYRPNMELFGYFQSEKYFKHNKDKIIELFSPSQEILDYLQAKYSHIIKNKNSVAIHWRSYCKEDPNQTYYLDCDREYYEKAIALFPKGSNFIVFTNELDKAKQLFSEISGNFEFIEGEADYHDFYLMSMCRHNIICNSSFSWWAAYLNKNPKKKVIVPKKWFNPLIRNSTKDLIPEEWIIVE